MNKDTYLCLGSLLLTGLSVNALTITSHSTDHLPYQRLVTMDNDEDTANASGSDLNMSFNVGGWSWRDLKTGADAGKGWGHTTDWILLELTENANVTFFQTLAVEDIGADDIAPGFTVYSGEKTTGNFSAAHSYSNDGSDMTLNDGWDLNDELGYFTSAFSLAAENISTSLYMPAGFYTIAIGNIADSNSAPTSANYDFRILTAVPEPSSFALMGGLLALGFTALRRRR